MPRQPDPFTISDAGALGLLARVLDGHRVVHLYASMDGDDVDTFGGVAIRHDDRRVSGTHGTLFGLLRCLEVGGDVSKEPKRKCPACNKPRRQCEYSLDKRGPGGRRRICRLCERARVKEYTTRMEAIGGLAKAVLAGDKADKPTKRRPFTRRQQRLGLPCVDAAVIE